MKGRIEQPYILSEDEKNIIAEKFSKYTDWEKSCFDEIKRHIKEFLRKEQDNRCCYCKKQLGFDLKDVDIEHIVPKSIRSEYTFEPYNLALSCPACNTLKGDADIQSTKFKQGRKSYPKDSSFYTIVHAHCDDYFEHIKIHDDLLYEGLTKKGCQTITTCELFRLKQAQARAQAICSQRNNSSRLLAECLSSANPQELADALKQIADIVSISKL